MISSVNAIATSVATLSFFLLEYFKTNPGQHIMLSMSTLITLSTFISNKSELLGFWFYQNRSTSLRPVYIKTNMYTVLYL